MKKVRLKSAWIVLSFCAISLAVSLANAQKVGDKVVVMTTSDLKIRDKVVGVAYAGEVHTLVSIEGNWCGIDNGKGWIPARSLMLLDAAKKVFDARISRNPNDWEALATRGTIYFEQEKLSESFVDFDKALRIEQKNANIFNNRGRVLHALNRYALALNDFSKAVALNPKFAHAFFNRGLVYYAMGDFKSAILDYDKAIELDKDEPWFFINRGNAKHASDDANGAVADFEQAAKLNPKIAEINIGKANVFIGKEDLDNALIFAEKAVSIDAKDPAALNTRGWILFKKKQYEKAMADFDAAIRLAPSLPLPYTNRGVLYLELKEYDNAIKDFNRSISLQPETAVLFVNRANAFLNQGLFDKAEADYKKAFALAPELPESLGGLAWFRAVCSDDKMRDGAKAVELAKKLCEKTGYKDANYVDTLAAAFAESGDFDNALKYGEMALTTAKPELKSKIEAHVSLFREKKPCRTDASK